jgi:hypothetical protein
MPGLILFLLVVWVLKNAAMDVMHAKNGTENPRFAARKRAREAAGGRYGFRDWWGDFWADVLQERTRLRREKARREAEKRTGSAAVPVDLADSPGGEGGRPVEPVARPETAAVPEDGAAATGPADPADPAPTDEPAGSTPPDDGPVPAGDSDTQQPSAPVIPLDQHRRRRNDPPPPAADADPPPPSPANQSAVADNDWITAAEGLGITCHGWPAVVDGLTVNGDDATTWAQCESRAFSSPGQTGCYRQWEINMRSTPDGRVMVVSVRMTHRGADPRNPEPRDYTPTGDAATPSRDAWIVYARNHLPRCGTCGAQSRLDPDNNHPHLRIADDGMSATVGAVAGPGCGSRYQIAMRAIRDGDICHIVHATTRVQACDNTEKEGTAMPNIAETRAEVVGLDQSINYADALRQTGVDHGSAGNEGYIGQLVRGGNSGAVIQTAREMQAAFDAAAAAAAAHLAELKKQKSIQEGYAANPDAGSKDYQLAGR